MTPFWDVGSSSMQGPRSSSISGFLPVDLSQSTHFVWCYLWVPACMVLGLDSCRLLLFLSCNDLIAFGSTVALSTVSLLLWLKIRAPREIATVVVNAELKPLTWGRVKT